MEDHLPVCKINFSGSSHSMESHGAVAMWNRSLALHNLRYTTFIGDGDSSSFNTVVKSAPYGSTLITKSDCIGHVQKRMGKALQALQSKHRDRMVVTSPAGARGRKGISGKGRLTPAVCNKFQNYYGSAIRENIGDKPAMIDAINAILKHYSNEHDLCPKGDDSWCDYWTDRSRCAI